MKSLFAKVIFGLAIFVSVVMPLTLSAQGIENTYKGTWRGKVITILDESVQQIFDTTYLEQTIQFEILDGPEKGQHITMINDFQPMEKGDKFYFNHNVFSENDVVYAIVHIDRWDSLVTLFIIFVIAVIAFGGWQGVRSLVALAASFLALLYILIPGILNGWNPLWASFLVAGAILFAAIFFTHGFNRESSVAYGGTMFAVLLTGVFSMFAVSITKLTGFAAEEAVYLNLNTDGELNFTALLLGAFIIGFLGVLDDIAVTQSAVVTELFGSNSNISKREVFNRAMRVGREHVGALVNTLVLAYTGAALPLLLYVYLAPTSFAATINSEIFATEIVRIIVGSIGLILTVPIVTGLAVFFLKGYTSKGHGHHHGHGHTH